METVAERSDQKTVVRSYRDLRVWVSAVDLAAEVHRVTKRLPKKDGIGFASQMQRAAASIPSNIAEGHGREHLGDYLRHRSIANGSLTELETHLCLAERLDALPREQVTALLQRAADVGRMLAGLRKALRARKAQP